MDNNEYKISNEFMNNISEIPERLQSKCLRELAEIMIKYADEMDSENVVLEHNNNEFMTWKDDDIKTVTDITGVIRNYGGNP